MTESQSPLNLTPIDSRLPPPPPPRQNIANNAGLQSQQSSSTGSANIQTNAYSSALPPTSAHQPAPLPPTSAHQPVPLPPKAQATRFSFGKDVQPTLEKLVQEAYEQGASDLHLGVKEIPRFRERGHIIVTPYPETDEVTFLIG